MIQALLADVLALGTVKPVLLWDDRLTPPVAAVDIWPIGLTDDFLSGLNEAMADCEAVWPVAPETEGLLEKLCGLVEASGKALLTSPASAVHLTASKTATLKRLARFNLPVVPHLSPVEFAGLDETERAAQLARAGASAWVVKPDDGVGCEGSVILKADAPLPTLNSNNLIQPFIAGQALSLSAIFAEGKARLLSVNRQHIEITDHGFKLQGCEVNAFSDDSGFWSNLANQVAAAIPELWGYAGVDLILTETGPVILEVNPRLTTSYSALRTATGENPAGLVLELWHTGRLPPSRIRWGIPITLMLEADFAD